MIELKAFNMPRYAGELTIYKVYLKHEADAVLAEKDAKIRRLKRALYTLAVFVPCVLIVGAVVWN